MSPLGIEMMLWFYYSPEPWPCWHSAQRDLADYFVRDGLITPAVGDKDYQLTKRGTLYVEALMAVIPPPFVEAAA